MRLVQLMGGASTNTPVPVLPEGAERWGLNNLYLPPTIRPRFIGWTRWFDLHTSEHIKTRKRSRFNCYQWLCEQQRPIYRWAVDPDMPASVVYPQEARHGSRLFCSTLDWMLALAIHEQFTHIELYGWRLSQQYDYQKDSANWWVQKAQTQGIEVALWGRSALVPRAKMNDRTVLKPVRGVLAPIQIPAGRLMYGLETTDRNKLYHKQG